MMDKPPPDLLLYEIRIKGHLDAQWMTWFDGLTITLEENGDTLLSGPVVDQPALYGILRRVRDLGMSLVSVVQINRFEKGERMNINTTPQKVGGFSALYMAVSHLIGIIIFIIVLDYLSITDPAQKLALNVENQMVVFSTNLLMYVFFGFTLIVLSLALYDLLKSGAPALMQVGTAIGIIWAGSLIASGMVANAGLATVAALYAKDPVQAVLTFQSIESVANGLGNANGEILGGIWTLLVSLAALRSGGLSKGLSVFGVFVGAIGIITILPALNDMTGLFGVGQIVWFVWLGIVLLRNDSGKMV